MRCQNPKLHVPYLDLNLNKIFFVVGFARCPRKCNGCRGELKIFPEIEQYVDTDNHCFRCMGKLMIRKLKVGDKNGS